MQDLSTLREGWDYAEAEETRLLRQLTIQESLRQWLRLQRAFEWQLQETAELFEADRKIALVELQARLQRLAEWQSRYGNPLSVDSENPTSSE